MKTEVKVKESNFGFRMKQNMQSITTKYLAIDYL